MPHAPLIIRATAIGAGGEVILPFAAQLEGETIDLAADSRLGVTAGGYAGDSLLLRGVIVRQAAGAALIAPILRVDHPNFHPSANGPTPLIDLAGQVNADRLTIVPGFLRPDFFNGDTRIGAVARAANIVAGAVVIDDTVGSTDLFGTVNGLTGMRQRKPSASRKA